MNSPASPLAVIGLLLLTAAVHLGPEALGTAGVANWRAWQYVGYGVEATVLWLLVGRYVVDQLAGGAKFLGAAATVSCVGGAMESLLRPLCRLSLPMNTFPPDGASLCSSAGMHTAQWTPLWAMCAAFCLAVYAERRTCKV